MSTPIAIVVSHGAGYGVAIGDELIMNSPYYEAAESASQAINAAFAETQAQRDYLLSTCDLMRSYLHLENDPQGVSGHMLALARHEVENAVNAAIARARREVGS